MKVNNLIVAFFSEDPPCSAQICPEMRAADWQYLCAVHDPPKACCAIDYCCHTLDWATNILTSPKHFPSRLFLGSEVGGGVQSSMRYLTNIFRRLYRIFAHAWFQHRDVFWQVESSEGLYILFKTVCDMYALIPEENYTVPVEAEGIDPSAASERPSEPQVTILRKEGEEPSVTGSEAAGSPTGVETTRRHKHSPSTGSVVTTIAEDNEEQHKLQEVEESPEQEESSQQNSSEEPEDQPAEKPLHHTDNSTVTVEEAEPEVFGDATHNNPEQEGKPTDVKEEKDEETSHSTTHSESAKPEIATSETQEGEGSTTNQPTELSEQTTTEKSHPEAEEPKAEAETTDKPESKTEPESGSGHDDEQNPGAESATESEGVSHPTTETNEQQPEAEGTSEPKLETEQTEKEAKGSSDS